MILQSDHNGARPQEFRIHSRSNEVITGGIDYSGKIERLHRNGEFQVWVKRSGSYFSGLGRQSYAEPWVVLVHTEGNPEGGVAIEVEGIELNRANSRSEKARLIKRCDELGSSEPIHTPPPAKKKKIKPIEPTPAEILEVRVQHILELIGDEPHVRERILESLANSQIPQP